MLTLTIKARRRTVVAACASLAEASEVYCHLRDRSGLGNSQFGSGQIVSDAGERYHVSYNGRVWAGDARGWQPGMAPAFDNRLPALA